jgi:hypothetical protein
LEAEAQELLDQVALLQRIVRDKAEIHEGARALAQEGAACEGYLFEKLLEEIIWQDNLRIPAPMRWIYSTPRAPGSSRP